jgi:hypothetical protein
LWLHQQEPLFAVSSKRYPIISQTNSVKESTPASWQRSGAVAISWSAAVWVVSSLPSGEIPLGKMSCADDLAGTAEAPHIADAIRCGAERFSLVQKVTDDHSDCFVLPQSSKRGYFVT